GEPVAEVFVLRQDRSPRALVPAEQRRKEVALLGLHVCEQAGIEECPGRREPFTVVALEGGDDLLEALLQTPVLEQEEVPYLRTRGRGVRAHGHKSARSVPHARPVL